MKIRKSAWAGLLAVSVLFSGLAQSAYAAHGKHGSNSPRVHFRGKKNMGPYGGKYLAPKKQHRPSGRYRSPVTGNILYGKPKR